MHVSVLEHCWKQEVGSEVKISPKLNNFSPLFFFLLKPILPDCSLDDGGSYFLSWALPALLLRKYILLILLACLIEFMFSSWLYFFSHAENFEVDASHWWKRWRGTTFPLQDISQLNIHKIQYRTPYPYISRVLYYMREAQDRKQTSQEDKGKTKKHVRAKIEQIKIGILLR